MSRNTAAKEAVCQICGTRSHALLRRAMIVRPAVRQMILQETGGHWDENGWICLDDLQRFQHHYVHSLLEAERGS